MEGPFLLLSDINGGFFEDFCFPSSSGTRRKYTPPDYKNSVDPTTTLSIFMCPRALGHPTCRVLCHRGGGLLKNGVGTTILWIQVSTDLRPVTPHLGVRPRPYLLS